MKTIFNIGHPLLMLFVWNYMSHITGFSAMKNNDIVYFCIALVSLLIGSILGGAHEWFQAQIDKSNFDKWDILRTAIGALAGAGIAVYFPQYKSEFLFDLSFVLYLAYWLAIVVRLKLSKRVVPGTIKALILVAALLTLFVMTSCEKDIVYVPLPQREIPADYMTEKESEIIRLNNLHRQSLGLHPYKSSLDLYHLAKDKALELKSRDTLQHDGFYDRYLASGALFFGESVAFGFETPESTLAAYYASDNHRPMFESSVYEFIATACVDQYNCTLAARYRPYSNSSRRFDVVPFYSQNLSIKEIHD